MQLDTTNTALRNLIRSLLGMPAGSVRPANQNAPTGSATDQFATVLLTPIGSEGTDDYLLSPGLNPNEITEKLVGSRRITASVQFFRGDALTKASRLESLMSSSRAIAAMQAAGLGLVTIHPVVNVAEKVDTYWEPRAQVSLEFYLITEEQDTLQSFGTFPVSVVEENQ